MFGDNHLKGFRPGHCGMFRRIIICTSLALIEGHHVTRAVFYASYWFTVAPFLAALMSSNQILSSLVDLIVNRRLQFSVVFCQSPTNQNIWAVNNTSNCIWTRIKVELNGLSRHVNFCGAQCFEMIKCCKYFKLLHRYRLLQLCDGFREVCVL